MDMSKFGGLNAFLSLNRTLINNKTLNSQIHIQTPVPTTPTDPTNPNPPEQPGIVYSSSDFGENAINSHNPGDSNHSATVQELFNYVTRNFRSRCTSYESFKPPINYGVIYGTNKLLEYGALVKADIVMVPYVNAALSLEGEYHDFVLPVGSHYDNDATDGIIGNGDRHDITSGPDKFLINAIAVSSRRDTPSEFMQSTSYGYGMEFFEDCSPQGLALDFPDEDMPTPFAELLSTDGLVLTSNIHLNFTAKLRVGDKITVRYSGDSNTWQDTYITAINSGNSMNVFPSITPITTSGIYGWWNTTLGNHVFGQAESWAVPIIAGKLKVIKMTTGKDWDTVRAAARATARRNPTGIPEIDNSNWDMYRGFGQINIQAAIDYINNN